MSYPTSARCKNPYKYASNELLKLKFLSTLQDEITQLEKSISQLMFDVHKVISTCCQFIPHSNPLEDFRNKTGSDLWCALQQPAGDGIPLGLFLKNRYIIWRKRIKKQMKILNDENCNSNLLIVCVKPNDR